MPRLDWYVRANLKLRQLQLLTALDELRHIGRVALYLNVSQPAVSKALAQLEAALGFALFERTRRGIVPTEQGTVLIKLAREVLTCMMSAREELLDIIEGRITRVSLGVLPALAPVLVPRFIARLEEVSSDVAVHVREGTMSSLLPALRAGEVDLIVGIVPERPPGVEFKSALLYEDPIVVAVRPEHPLATSTKLDWPALSGYPLVLPPRGTTVRDFIDHFMTEHDIVIPRRNLESLSTLTNVGVLQFTDSVGFLAHDLAAHYEAQDLLCILPLTLPNITMRVGLTWMTARRTSAAHRLIEQLLHAVAAATSHTVTNSTPALDS